MSAPLQKSLAVLAEKGDFKAFKVALTKNPTAKDEKSNDSGRTPLIAATITKHYEIVQMLLDWGADVNVVDRGGDSALHHACASGDEKMIKMLLDYGADTNYINFASHNTPLFEAILHGHSAACLLLLEQPYVDLTHRSALGKDTAIILAAEAGLLEVVESLIEKGADLNAVNHWQSTALLTSIKKHHFEIAKVLARAGADLQHKDSSEMNSLDLLKHSPEQLVILQDCGEFGRIQSVAIERISRDDENLKSIAALGELQKMNVALYIMHEWGIANIDLAFRIVNVATRPPPPRDITEQATNRKRIHSATHDAGSVGRDRIQSLPLGSPDAIAKVRNKSVIVTGTPSSTVRKSLVGGPPPIEAHSPVTIGSNASSSSNAIAKSHELSQIFDCKGTILPSHWFQHFFINALKTDRLVHTIDITGNPISSAMAMTLIDTLKQTSTVQCIRSGQHGLDFNISVNPPIWYIDYKYLALCSAEILSKLLLAFPMLFIAKNETLDSPAVFAGGNSTSHISPIILHVFEDIASQPDFHPSHIQVPVDSNCPSAKAIVPGETVTGFIFDIYHHAFWFHLISLDQFANLAKIMTTEYPHLAHQLDHLHRDVQSQSSPECRKKIISATLIYDRYSVTDYKPVHAGSSSHVYLAVDEMSDITPKPQVALKFVKAKWQFDRELGTRAMYALDYEVILDCYKVNGKRENYQPASTHLGYDRLLRFKKELKRVHAHQRTLAKPETEHDHKSNSVPRLQSTGVMEGDSYPYCLVFPQADRDLVQVMQHELSNANGVNWEYIQQIAKQVASALKNMHSLKIIHGDIRPLNIMRVGHRILLIDLDSSLHFSQFITSSVTQGYMPPELVYLYTEQATTANAIAAGGGGVVNDSGSGTHSAPVMIHSMSMNKTIDGKRLRAKCKTMLDNETSGPGSSFNNQEPASPAYDMWSFGVLLYYLCLNESLWLENLHGDISEDSMIKLGLWKPEYKAKKLGRIANPQARNLVAQLLSKDPLMRPSATRALAHPFLSGKKVTRMVGESAEYDVFISYRVKADKDLALRLYDDLTRRGLKCFLDKRCLKKGVSWEQGFCDGLAQSLTFLALLSRQAINNPDNSRSDFSKLRSESPVDNVFLEHRLALELGDVGLIERILPVQIGDLLPDGRYSNFSASRCAPVLSNNVVVHSVEEKLKEHMDRLGLGTPMKEEVTVKQVYDNLMLHQGVYIEGHLDESLASLVDMITHMVEEAKAKAQLKYLTFAGWNDRDSGDDDAQLVVDIDADLELTLACPTSSDGYTPSDMPSAHSVVVAQKLFGMDSTGLQSPHTSSGGGGGTRGVLAARDAKIQELEKENKALKAEVQALRLQLEKHK